MLTNNKKSTFIKSIAMIMAVLMVLAVALTGCGNKAAEEAATKADQAQTTATEAKTAAEAVAAALKDYLKVTDAVTAAAIDAMIAEAIGDCLTIEDLAGYVKSDELAAVDNKLANYVLATALAGEITKALEGYATSAGMTDSIAAAKTELEGKIAAAIQAADKTATINELNNKITAIAGDYLKKADKDALQNAINGVSTTVAGHTTTLANLQTSITNLTNSLNKQATDAAAAYATKAAVEELKTADGKLAADIKQLQETVLAILEAFGVKTEEASEKTLAELLAEFSPADITALIADKMSLTDWNDATEMVLDTIANVQGMMAKIYGEDGVAGTIDDGIYTQEDKNTINASVAKVDADIVVFDKDGELTEYATVAKMLEYRILRVPTVAAMNELNKNLQDALNVKTFDEKLAALTAELKALGCEHAEAGKTLKYQVVTIDNLNALYTWNDKFDALIVSYAYDAITKENQFVGTEYANTFGAMTVYMAVKGTKKDNADVYLIVAKDADLSKYTNASYAGYAWTKVCYTINNTLGAEVGSKWAPKYTVETGLTTDAVALYKLPNVATDFAWTSAVNVDKTFADGHGKLAIAVAADGKVAADLAETYAAVYAQLENAVVAINVANDTFQKFLDNKVVNGIVTIDNKQYTLAEAVAANKATKTDAYYLEALSIDMCEPLTATTDTLFLILDVQEDMEYALNLNTCALNKTEGQHSEILTNRIAKYDLYYDMQEKAWHLLFDEYQKRAIALLDRIINDYKSIVDGVAAIDNDNYDELDVTGYENATWEALKLQGLVTEGFANAFLNGVDKFTWQAAGTVAKTGITIEKTDFNKWAIVNYYGYATNPITGEVEFVENNGAAATGDKAADVIWSNPIATLADNVNTIKLLLMANTLKVKAELAALQSTDAKFADTANRDVRTAFNSYLNTGIANLEEVYNRFLFEDYKKDLINDLYYAAGIYTDFYSVDDDSAEALIEALEHYITGYSVTAKTAATGTANKLFANEELLNNKTVLNYFNSVVVDKDAFDATAEENYWNVVDAATSKKAAVAAKAAEFLNVMENAAIKNNFKSYLKTASDNLQYVYLQYMSNTLAADLVDLLEGARKTAMYNISIIEYQVKYNNDAEALLNYKTWYKQLLGLIASKDKQTAAHVEYLWETTVAAEIAKIKSTADLAWVSGIHYVVRPVAIVASLGQYYCFGSAVVTLDAAANHNTQYTVVEGTATVTKNLY